MQGLLSDLPLLGVLELIHTTRQTGVLEVQADVPFTVAFVNGEIVSGGILDWLGSEALHASPMLPESGMFTFEPRAVTGTPLGAYGHFSTDWARISDEWGQVCGVIGSPSRVFQGQLPLFDVPQGRSVRAAAREAEVPLFQVAQVVAQAVRDGRLEPQDRFEWFRLRLMPTRQRAALHPVARVLDGERTLGDAVSIGTPLNEVRDYLLGELRLGLRFPGSGWVLRDLVWEQKNLS
ncbi:MULTISPECIES: DUF4388 domain-containing protein [unclassified Deinococcus]|uniref:DUF4388 domain-containing protein n=1 Tax=unclassified Deinococcus TaxID=2623546 RepID=UPI00099201FC|nr:MULTISPECIES: DUF4388 domain-containing protein [unclassified Deinococcus]MBX8463774.1 DUF4388 domain-containing protein [Deinococcus sp. RIT780]MCD0159567.1 DUF4388 domain-containing protein [Deinococcus sp. 6GRE01]MCD0163983.1 DUF4388 domain-containing protein [Deinococcus sp. 6YEL10]MCD0167834.1 DUF4388 domain-containing protein [Deinococcus sp. 12RED42]MCD0171874.1 DUF4388 domain-containing protein [Deinococcus sp. 23YEL01]